MAIAEDKRRLCRYWTALFDNVNCVQIIHIPASTCSLGNFWVKGTYTCKLGFNQVGRWAIIRQPFNALAANAMPFTFAAVPTTPAVQTIEPRTHLVWSEMCVASGKISGNVYFQDSRINWLDGDRRWVRLQGPSQASVASNAVSDVLYFFVNIPANCNMAITMRYEVFQE